MRERDLRPAPLLSGKSSETSETRISRKIRVVRLIARMNVGGPARHVSWLTAGLQHAGYQSWLVTGKIGAGEVDMGSFAAENGVLPITIPDMGREISTKDTLALFKFYRLLRRLRPDIVHTHTAKAGTTGRLAAALYKWLTPGTLIGKPRAVKVIHTFHGNIFSGYYGPWKTKLFVWIERFLARCATDRIVVICQQQLEELQRQYKIGRPGQYEIISLGLDLSAVRGGLTHRADFRAEIGAAPDDLLVGIVGRLVKIKNHELFLSAASLVVEKLKALGSKRRITFLVVGEGDRREELERRACELGLQEHVRFLGHRDDAQRVYAGLDVVALTSSNEGTPLSLLEAMANARPVISTSVGGVPGMIGDSCADEGERPDGFAVGERGVLVAPDDAQGFANGVIHLFNDPKLRRELGENGLDFVQKSFCKDRLVFDMQSLYAGLMKSI